MFAESSSTLGDVLARTQNVDGVAVVAVSGNVDFQTCPSVVEQVNFALAADPAALVVDFSDVDTVSSSGLAVLVGARRAADRNMVLSVVANGTTRRSIEVTGIDQMVNLHATLTDALTSINASRRLGDTG